MWQVAELEAEVGDLQREVELRQEQETALKEVRLRCAHVPFHGSPHCPSFALASAAESMCTRRQTLREVERQHTREKLGQDGKGTDIHYLKNVILKLYETGTACTL